MIYHAKSIIKCFSRNSLRFILALTILSALVPSCSKTHDAPGAASLILVNGMVGSQYLSANFGGSSTPLHYYVNGFKTTYGIFYSGEKLNGYSGACKLALYNYPDTNASKPVLDLNFDLPIGTIHSLLLAGTLADPDTLFIEDHLPFYSLTDSSTGIRFVNLSPNSHPISINLTGGADGSEVSSLPYKGVTGFQPYKATSDISNYTFEFRDAASGNLITTYTAYNVGLPGQSYGPNNWMFRNNTLALIGSPDSVGTYQQKVLLINNF